jgi:hypothetical protein
VLGEADLAEGLAKCGISLGPQELRLLGDRLQGVTPSAADAGLATARGTEGGAGAGKGGKDGRDDRVFTYEQFARALKGDDPVPEQLFIPAAAGAAGGVALGGAWGVPVLEGGSGGGGGAGAMPAPYGGGFGGADGAGSTSMAVTMASPTAARTRADYGDPVVYKAGYRPHRYEPPLHATQGRSGQGLPRNQAHDSRGAYLSIINSGGGESIGRSRLAWDVHARMALTPAAGRLCLLLRMVTIPHVRPSPCLFALCVRSRIHQLSRTHLLSSSVPLLSSNYSLLPRFFRLQAPRAPPPPLRRPACNWSFWTR